MFRLYVEFYQRLHNVFNVCLDGQILTHKLLPKVCKIVDVMKVDRK